jgi:hypothetical protein
MRARSMLIGIFLVTSLAGCTASSRYQFAGKREYPNFTEIYYLDVKEGRVCAARITNDNSRLYISTCSQGS